MISTVIAGENKKGKSRFFLFFFAGDFDRSRTKGLCGASDLHVINRPFILGKKSGPEFRKCLVKTGDVMF